MTVDAKLWWMIHVLRASIALDWGKLATEILIPEERKTITQRLRASSNALKDVKNALHQLQRSACGKVDSVEIIHEPCSFRL